MRISEQKGLKILVNYGNYGKVTANHEQLAAAIKRARLQNYLSRIPNQVLRQGVLLPDISFA